MGKGVNNVLLYTKKYNFSHANYANLARPIALNGGQTISIKMRLKISQTKETF